MTTTDMGIITNPLEKSVVSLEKIFTVLNKINDSALSLTGVSSKLDDMKKILTDIHGDILGKIIKPLGGFINSFKNSMAENKNPPIEANNSLASTVLTNGLKMLGVSSALIGIITLISGTLKDILVTVIQGLVADKMKDGLKGIFSKILDPAKKAVGASGTAGNAVDKVSGSSKKVTKGMESGAGKMTKGMGSRTMNILTDIGSRTMNILKGVGSSAMNILKGVGSSAMNILKGVGSSAMNMTKGVFGPVMKQMGSLKTALGGLGGKFGALMKISPFGSMISGAGSAIARVSALTSKYLALGVSSLMTGAKMALAWVIGIAPIVLIIAGVLALGAGIFLLVKHWDTVKNAVVNFGTTAWAWINKIADVFGLLLFPIFFLRIQIQGIIEIWKFFQGMFETFEIGGISGAINYLISSFHQGIESIKSMFSQLFSAEFWLGMIENVKNWFFGLGTYIGDVWEKLKGGDLDALTNTPLEENFPKNPEFMIQPKLLPMHEGGMESLNNGAIVPLEHTNFLAKNGLADLPDATTEVISAKANYKMPRIDLNPSKHLASNNKNTVFNIDRIEIPVSSIYDLENFVGQVEDAVMA